LGEAKRCSEAGTSYSGAKDRTPQEQEQRQMARRLEKARLRVFYEPPMRRAPFDRAGKPQGVEMERKSPIISLLEMRKKLTPDLKLGRAERRMRAKRGARST
jgi:hypothetical protein